MADEARASDAALRAGAWQRAARAVRSLAPRLHPFRPRLLDDLAGYDARRFGADLGAGISVGIVALPLAMAFAIASGVKPEQGIFTAIIAGFLISALGGSSVQIGGPAGAFIVIVYGIVQRYGVANLLISTVLAGVLLLALGWLRLGALVRYIPVSIVIGFTNGIAVLIAVSQVKDLLGLQHRERAGRLLRAGARDRGHLGDFNPAALGPGATCVVGLLLWARLARSRHRPLARAWPCSVRCCPPIGRGGCAAHDAHPRPDRRPRRALDRDGAARACRSRRSAPASAASRASCRRSSGPTSTGRACSACSCRR